MRMVFITSLLFGSVACGSDAENVVPLTCPAPSSKEAQLAHETSVISTRQFHDEIVMGDMAVAQVEPGAGLGGNVIVCGRSARLILRDAVYSRVLVSGTDVAELVLQDDIPTPNDVELLGQTTRTVRCSQDKPVPDRPACSGYFIHR